MHSRSKIAKRSSLEPSFHDLAMWSGQVPKALQSSRVVAQRYHAGAQFRWIRCNLRGMPLRFTKSLPSLPKCRRFSTSIPFRDMTNITLQVAGRQQMLQPFILANLRRLHRLRLVRISSHGLQFHACSPLISTHATGPNTYSGDVPTLRTLVQSHIQSIKPYCTNILLKCIHVNQLPHGEPQLPSLEV